MSLSTSPAASPPVALTIAGSDPSGGAGIQADLATSAAHAVHGTSVITALTAQNTVGVQGVRVTPVDFVAAQLDSVCHDIDLSATKTGMLADEGIVELVAQRARQGDLPALVVDPVMVSSTGARLLSVGAERAYVAALLPRAVVVTPNLREATVLLRLEAPLRSATDVVAHRGALADLCPDGWVVVTGGHVTDEDATDVVIHGDDLHELRGPWADTENDHGTGCTFASAVAAGLARGDEPLTAIAAAKVFVAGQIKRSARWRIGAGRGPVAHVLGP